MNFHLREHVRHVLATTPGEDLDALVEAVFRATPPEMYADAYRQALAPVVRVALATAERPAPETARLDQPGDDTHRPFIESGLSSGEGGQLQIDTHTGTTPLPGTNIRNSRAARILRRNRFRASISIGDGMYRDILDCTVADLERAAAESEQLAGENYAAAQRYRELIKIMAQNHVETAGELSDEMLEEAFTDGQ